MTTQTEAYEQIKKFEEERRTNQIFNTEFLVTVRTRVPSKWRLIDLETGEVYGIDEAAKTNETNGGWKKVHDIEYKVK